MHICQNMFFRYEKHTGYSWRRKTHKKRTHLIQKAQTNTKMVQYGSYPNAPFFIILDLVCTNQAAHLLLFLHKLTLAVRSQSKYFFLKLFGRVICFQSPSPVALRYGRYVHSSLLVGKLQIILHRYYCKI